MASGKKGQIATEEEQQIILETELLRMLESQLANDNSGSLEQSTSPLLLKDLG